LINSNINICRKLASSGPGAVQEQCHSDALFGGNFFGPRFCPRARDASLVAVVGSGQSAAQRGTTAVTIA
jgi:lysine/ornithine N-monooxygenase